jgi:esterase/lipase
MRWMGEYLHRGDTPAGRSSRRTDPEDMVRSRWTDWTGSVEDGYQLLRGVTEDIFLVGLSMGGILSLLMSTRLKVRGVVAMATPARMPTNHPVWLLQLMSLYVKYRPETNEEPGSGWCDKAAWQDHIAYPRGPLSSRTEEIDPCDAGGAAQGQCACFADALER